MCKSTLNLSKNLRAKAFILKIYAHRFKSQCYLLLSKKLLLKLLNSLVHELK